MTSVELTNTNPFHQLRIFQQNRSRNVVAATEAPARPKCETREEIQARGEVMTTKMCRGTVNEGGILRSVERAVPTPMWQAGGWGSLPQYITETMEEQLRIFQQAAPSAPRGQRVLDSWENPKGFASIAPHEKKYLQMDESQRYLIECDSECVLQIANVSTVRTLKLKNRDKDTGHETQVAFVAPTRAFAQSAIMISGASGASVADYSQAKVLIVNGQSQGCIELMPS